MILNLVIKLKRTGEREEQDFSWIDFSTSIIIIVFNYLQSLFVPGGYVSTIVFAYITVFSEAFSHFVNAARLAKILPYWNNF